MKKYSIRQIQKIINEYNAIGQSQPILQKYHISKSTLFNWKRELTQRKSGHYTINSYSAYDINNMKRQMAMLKIDNEILRQAGCSIESPTEEKIKAVDKLAGKYKISKICNVIKLAKSTYYRREKSKTEESNYQKSDNELKPLIQKYFDLSKERFGGEKIRIMLIANHNMYVSKKRILRLMKEMNLISKQARGARAAIVQKETETLPNFVHRNFSSLKPNQVWVSDITYLPIDNGYYYMCAIIDLFSRRVIAYQISKKQDVQLVINTFTDAYKLRGPRNLIFHSDRGIQYKNKNFSELLLKKNVTQSFSRSGCPLDNAVIEGFFSVMKREEISHHYYKTIEKLKQQVQEYITFFNEIRPMKILNNLSPIQYETKYLDSIKQGKAEIRGMDT